jgi:hypothetical protein
MMRCQKEGLNRETFVRELEMLNSDGAANYHNMVDGNEVA